MENNAIAKYHMKNSTEYYTRRNIASWDEAAPKHESINSTLIDEVKCADFNNLNPDFNNLIEAYGVEKKSVIHVCCNNGIDLLSLKNKGADRCLGVDGSRAFIDQAILLGKSAGQLNIEYRCSDVYELPADLHSSFDIVLITVGVLGWMPDVARFMETCSSLLLPGGCLLMEEIHPILGMYEEGNPSFIDSSYFTTEPYRDTNGLDYFTYEKYDAKENFWFHHPLENILMSALSNKLQLEHIKELNYNIGNFCADLEFAENNPPLGINLAWRKNE